MRHNVMTGCAALLLSLALVASSFAQTAIVCTAGTIGGKCINPNVANAAQQRSKLLVFQGSRFILPIRPGQEAGIADPLLQSQKFQPQFGLDASGGGALSGAGSPNFVYGRWN